MSLVIGRRFDNRSLELPWPGCPHILIGGETGSGKSGVVAAIIGAVAGRPDTAVVGIDLKLVELSMWQPRFTKCATTPGEADQLLADLRRLINIRAKLLQALGLRMWRSALGPWILFVVDELAELAGFDHDALIEAVETGEANSLIRASRNNAQIRTHLLSSLARIARSCGVTIVAATQYPSAEVIDQQIRTQLAIRIMLRVASAEQVDVCLGRGYGKRIGVRSIPVKQRGGLWIAGLPDDPEPLRARAHFLDDNYITGLARASAHLAWPAEVVFGPSEELPEAS